MKRKLPILFSKAFWRVKYREWRCWFYFKHMLASLGKVANSDMQRYRCCLCFKEIIVVPFGADKGAIAMARSEEAQQRNFIGQPADPIQTTFMRGRGMRGSTNVNRSS